MNGFELYKDIRRDPHTKVCFLTILTDLTQYAIYKEEEYPKKGERCFVIKPIEYVELLHIVTTIIKEANRL